MGMCYASSLFYLLHIWHVIVMVSLLHHCYQQYLKVALLNDVF